MALRTFRESFKWLIWIVSIAFIAWLVFELGANILNFQKAKPWEQGIVAEVGDVKISSNYYEALVQREIQETLRVRKVESISADEEEAIREAVFFRMVDNIRWKKLAEKLGFKLSDKAILTLVALIPPPELMNDTNFMRDGKFNYQLYLRVLNDKRYAPIFSAHEARLRDEIPPDLARMLVSKIPLPSKEYLWKRFQFENTKYGFSFINLVYARIKDEKVKKPSESELKEYFEKNKERFKRPPTADLYVVRLEKAPSKADSLQARDLIERAKKEAKINWEGAVKTYSEDENTKENKGDLGWLYVYTLPPEVRSALENADTDQVLGPFDVPGGYNIVKLLGKNEKGDSVHLAHIFVSVKTSYQTKQILRDTLMKFLNLAHKKGFKEAAKELGLRVDSTGKFKLNLGFIPFIGPDRSLMNFIKNSKKGDISGIIYKTRYYLVVQVVDKDEGGIPNFERVKKEVEREYLLSEKKKLALKIAKEVVDKLKKGGNPDTLRNQYSEYGIYIGKADSSSYTMFVPGISNKDVLYRALQIMKTDEWSGPYDYGDGVYYIVKYYEIKPDRKEFESKFQQLLFQNQQQEAMKIITNLQRELEDIMPLKDYRGYIY